MTSSRECWGTGLLSYGLAALAGIMMAAWLFPASFLFPDPRSVLAGDAITHAIGQRYFIAEPWHWPPLWIRNVMPPGVPIGFMDSIPLLAVLLKLGRELLSPAFHGIGLWYGIAWVLQPVAAIFCIRCAGERRLLPCLAFAVMAVSIPAWWARYGHAALTGHFVLLFGLGLYFRLLSPKPVGAWVGALVLVLCALLIHPYLLVMSLALIIAAPATLVWRAIFDLSQRAPYGSAGKQWERWRPGILSAVSGLLVLATVAVVSRVLGYGGNYGTETFISDSSGHKGYGIYSLNILSPIWPFLSGLLPNPSDFVHISSAAGFEGYNWLGLGLILSVVLGILLRPRDVPRALHRHAGLVVGLVILTCLAITTRVGFGSKLLFDLGQPPQALLQFRASGRLFWPVAYTLALAGILILARLRAKPLWIAALLLIPAVQWVDAGPLRARLHELVRTDTTLVPEAEALRGILPSVRVVTVLPSYYCSGGGPDAQYGELLLQLLGVVSERTLPVNTGYVGRQPRPLDCRDDFAPAATPLQPGEVRIFTRPDGDTAVALGHGRQHECARVGRVVFCRPAGEDLPILPTPSLAAGLGFAAGGSGLQTLMDGWYTPEEAWTWSRGQRASLVLRQRTEADEPLRLEFQLVGFAPPSREAQRVRVSANGEAIAEWEIPHMKLSSRSLDVPAGQGPVLLEFSFETPSSPREHGMSTDPRLLAMALRSMRLRQR
ncbi:DUF6311 domain-containing protein [Muricoccus pecuniae]|uniref:4-amino-4-deoxy-L-arabinose transferase n=1 Tax=Muricoccus pecuniae TaxID=693023 RepID=A0A840YFZ2_9PROT|nr:DUF6311 domain-containing protein [Roseomonas pecuniae]MBB5693402.1 hypothetical protein [Roseomonas pecuniae]